MILNCPFFKTSERRDKKFLWQKLYCRDILCREIHPERQGLTWLSHRSQGPPQPKFPYWAQILLIPSLGKRDLVWRSIFQLIEYCVGIWDYQFLLVTIGFDISGIFGTFWRIGAQQCVVACWIFWYRTLPPPTQISPSVIWTHQYCIPIQCFIITRVYIIAVFLFQDVLVEFDLSSARVLWYCDEVPFTYVGLAGFNYFQDNHAEKQEFALLT